VTGDGTIDRERLQTTLDDIAEVVEWGSKWIEYLEEEEVRVGTSDRAILKAQAARLRVVADAVLPDRIRDPRSGRRLYLAPDDVAAHALELGRALDEADAEVEGAERETEASRAQEEEREERKKREKAEAAHRDTEERAQVRAFLEGHGPSTPAQIAAGTGLSKIRAEWAAEAVATRTKGRFAITADAGSDQGDEEG
jgi:hypothetical protein